MSLIGPFYNAVNEDSNIFDITEFISPDSFSLGVIPSDYIFEELKVIVTMPAPAGTTFKVIDHEENIIIPAGRVTVDRTISSTVNINKRITTQIHLTAVLEGPAAAAPLEMVLIKKVFRIP